MLLKLEIVRKFEASRLKSRRTIHCSIASNYRAPGFIYGSAGRLYLYNKFQFVNSVATLLKLHFACLKNCFVVFITGAIWWCIQLLYCYDGKINYSRDIWHYSNRHWQSHNSTYLCINFIPWLKFHKNKTLINSNSL